MKAGYSIIINSSCYPMNWHHLPAANHTNFREWIKKSARIRETCPEPVEGFAAQVGMPGSEFLKVAT